MTEPWSEDLAFQTLARKIADGVLWAINSGERISRVGRFDPRCMCPLGAVMAATLGEDRPRALHYPGPRLFLDWLTRQGKRAKSKAVLPDAQMVWAFIHGFEQGRESLSEIGAVRASGRLGIVYRERMRRRAKGRWRPDKLTPQSGLR